MKKIVTILIGILCLISQQISAQQMNKPSTLGIAHLPLWEQAMCVNNPNVFEVDELYRNYYLFKYLRKIYMKTEGSNLDNSYNKKRDKVIVPLKKV